MIDFGKAIDSGLEGTNQVERNFKEVNDTFNELDRQLKMKVSPDISIKITNESGVDIVIQTILSRKFNDKVVSGYVCLSVSEESIVVAHWSQDKSGYPFTLKMNTGSIDCWDQDSLIGGLSELVSDPGFWLKYKSLLAKNDDSQRNTGKENLPF